MRPKLGACVDAIRGGAQSAHIIDGRKPALAAGRALHRRRHRHDGDAMNLTDLQALEQRYLMRTYKRAPVEFVRGEGSLLWDAEGKEYLDFLAGISVCSVGHCNPEVVEAVREQAGRLMHTSNLFYTEPMVRLAERLSESSLGGRVFFSNSGTEANECAIKIARKHAHRRGIGRRRSSASSATSTAAPTAPSRRRRRSPPTRTWRRCCPASARCPSTTPGAARRGRGEHRRGPDRADPGRGRHLPAQRRGAAGRAPGLRREPARC